MVAAAASVFSEPLRMGTAKVRAIQGKQQTKSIEALYLPKQIHLPSSLEGKEGRVSWSPAIPRLLQMHPSRRIRANTQQQTEPSTLSQPCEATFDSHRLELWVISGPALRRLRKHSELHTEQGEKGTIRVNKMARHFLVSQ